MCSQHNQRIEKWDGGEGKISCDLFIKAESHEMSSRHSQKITKKIIIRGAERVNNLQAIHFGISLSRLTVPHENGSTWDVFAAG